jgi:hypothetical protein
MHQYRRWSLAGSPRHSNVEGCCVVAETPPHFAIRERERRSNLGLAESEPANIVLRPIAVAMSSRAQ